MSKISPDQVNPTGQFGPSAKDCFLNSRQVRHRYGGASEMWLWRRLNDDSGFPKPIEICARRFWRLSALVAWENSLGVMQNKAR
jgi:predicted DNA-binding transcriptional regulator AlpA